MKIAILDIIGTEYNGDTVDTKGLGGSESAVIYMGRELQKLGVTVYVYCNTDKPGNYDGVEYRSISNMCITNSLEFDVLVTSRTLAPYATPELYEHFRDVYDINPEYYKKLVNISKHKVLWMHDTFCGGDEFMQQLLADGMYDEIFTLSDWHSSYVSTATAHGEYRHPEFFKSRMFHTRNGIKSYIDEVDLSAKDKNLFVYNASVTKGMIPLLETVWPAIKERIPTAKLKVVGGYYNFNEGYVDEFRNKYDEMKDNCGSEYDVEFTGIITQAEVALVMAEATYFIYPNTYPETFGISVTEAINYNTVMIGYDFGALEETSPGNTSYKVDFYYGFHDISLDKLLEQVELAYNDEYLLQQKQYACNEYKPFLGWDVPALQWKHHFTTKLGMYMDIAELKKHRYNMSNINRLYKKRMINTDEYVEDYSSYEQQQITVISPVFNAIDYIEDHIRSVASQMYGNYKHIIIDDMSDDGTYGKALGVISTLDESVRSNFICIKNHITKLYAVGNQVETISMLKDDCIVVLLDGDDSLVNDPDIFSFINREYTVNNLKFTYGSCRSIADNIDLVAQPYPKQVILDKSYRSHNFNWGIPYTHLRTFKKSLFDSVSESVFKDEYNEYWKAGGDNAMFYPLIEKCEPSEIKCIQRVLVNYNDVNPLNDYKVNGEEQNATRDIVINSIGDKYEKDTNSNTYS